MIETTNYLNSVIKGRTLVESKKIINEEIQNDKLSIDKVAEKLINEGIACWDDASKKNKLIVTGTSKLLDDVSAIEQLEDARVLIEKLENKKNLIGILMKHNKQRAFKSILVQKIIFLALLGAPLL